MQSGKMVAAQLELHLYDTKDFAITGRSSQTLDRTTVQAGRSFNILDSVLFFRTQIKKHVQGGVGSLEPDPGT